MSLNTNFLFFLSSTSLLTMGLHCLRFAVAWHAAKQTGSATVFAAIMAIATLFEVYARPILSPLADYFDRLKVYRWCGAVGILTALILIVCTVAFPFSPVVLTVLLVVLSLSTALRDPTSAAIVPMIVAPAELPRAQALRSTVFSLVQLTGTMVGGATMALGGVTASLITAATLALLAVALSLNVIVPETGGATAPRSWSHYVATWHHRIADGLRALWLTPPERTGAIGLAMSNCGLFPFTAIVLPLWVIGPLQGTPLTMATIEICLGVGMLVGSFVITGFLNRQIGSFWSMVLGNAVMGASLLVASRLNHVALICACGAVLGIGLAMLSINIHTLRAVCTPPLFRARMSGAAVFLACCLYPLLTPFYGWAIEATSPAHGAALAGLFISIGALIIGSSRSLRELMSKPPESLAGAYGVLYPNAYVDRDAISPKTPPKENV